MIRAARRRHRRREPARGGVLFTIRLPVKAEGGSRDEGRGKVFLLDDDELIVSMLERALKGEGYDVRAESDPEGSSTRSGIFPRRHASGHQAPGRDGIDILGEIAAGDPHPGCHADLGRHGGDRRQAMKVGGRGLPDEAVNLDEVDRPSVGSSRGGPEARSRIPRKISSDLTHHKIVGKTKRAPQVEREVPEARRCRCPDGPHHRRKRHREGGLRTAHPST